MLYRVFERGFCDFVECDALCFRRVKPERHRKVPAYRFTLTVRVGRKQDEVALLCFLFQFVDKLALAAYVDILRLKAVFDINTQLALGQITHMTL